MREEKGVASWGLAADFDRRPHGDPLRQTVGILKRVRDFNSVSSFGISARRSHLE